MAKAKKKSDQVKIGPNLENYAAGRNAKGKISFNSGDDVAQLLEGLDLKQVVKVASSFLGVTAISINNDYNHLNAGQKRMNIGNRIRGMVTRYDETKEGSGLRVLKASIKEVV